MSKEPSLFGLLPNVSDSVGKPLPFTFLPTYRYLISKVTHDLVLHVLFGCQNRKSGTILSRLVIMPPRFKNLLRLGRFAAVLYIVYIISGLITYGIMYAYILHCYTGGPEPTGSLKYCRWRGGTMLHEHAAIALVKRYVAGQIFMFFILNVFLLAGGVACFQDHADDHGARDWFRQMERAELEEQMREASVEMVEWALHKSRGYRQRII